MTPRQEKALERHIVKVAPLLGLDDWSFRLHPEGASAEALAEVSCVYGRNIAHISLCSDWWERHPAERQNAIVHELLHVVLNPVSSHIDQTLPDILGKPAWHMFRRGYQERHEHAVDTIANALSPHLPVCEEVR